MVFVIFFGLDFFSIYLLLLSHVGNIDTTFICNLLASLSPLHVNHVDVLHK